jgi:predicted ATPase/DNA-binding winged helix-turn-helix (wHTH) protein
MPDQDRRPVYQSGEYEIDLARRELRARGSTAPVGTRAFEILEVLVQSAGALVTKDDLMDRVWRGAIVEENTLQVHISAVRKALGAQRSMLRTESGRGYRLLGNWIIRPEEASPAAAYGEPAPLSTSAFRTNLPAMASDMIGRDGAVRHLQVLLSAYREVTLTGPGGIGKTTLALEVARSLYPGYQGDVWLVELVSASNDDVPMAVAGALGLKLAGETSAETVGRAIGDKRLLLVLDNCEQVIDGAAETVERLVRLCPNTTILATSREVLRVEGEYVYRVTPLDVPPPTLNDPDDVLEHGAVQLFAARTRALASEFSPRGENLQAIASICRRLDGIPLAIEFAAARAATLGIPQVAALLDDRFGLLTDGRRTARPRHRTLRATLDWSYDLLPESEATVLRRLAVFSGNFSLDAAIGVAGDVTRARLVDHIVNLVAKSLIVADPRDEAARYRLLETTRLYALEKLSRSGELPATARRHAEYYRHLLAPAEAESETRPQAEWLATYGRHLDNVRAALDWAFSPGGDPQLGAALAIVAVPLWTQLSLLGECRERVERALASLDPGAAATARPRMQLSAALGWALMYGLGRARESGPAWAVTLELAEALDDRDYQRRALWGLCIDQFNNGEFRTALEFARRFASLVTGSADAIDLMLADRILATSLHFLGDQKGARHHIDRVLAQQAALTDQSQIVRMRFDQRVSAHYFQARILWLQGFTDHALRVVEHNVEEGRAIGHALSFCSVLGQGACPIAFQTGDLDAAARYGAMLLDHTERHPVRLWQLWARCFNAMVMIKRGDTAGGLAGLRRELEQAGDSRYLPRFLMPLGELAACLGEAGEVARGLATVDEALVRCKTRDEGWYLAELLRIKGELLLRQAADQAVAAAEECFRDAQKMAEEQGALFWELRAALSLARLGARQDRQDGVREILAPVYDRFTEGFATADMISARNLLGYPLGARAAGARVAAAIAPLEGEPRRPLVE